MLGARTNRYGDFIDICAAITGRAPAVGLHLTENRRGQILFQLADIPPRLLREDVLFPVLGYLIGAQAGTKIPVIDGLLPDTTEDQLKALGAATASSGAVALFHAIGVTPEAATFEEAFQHQPPEQVIPVTLADLRATLAAFGHRPRRQDRCRGPGQPPFLHGGIRAADAFAGAVPAPSRCGVRRLYPALAAGTIAAAWLVGKAAGRRRASCRRHLCRGHADRSRAAGGVDDQFGQVRPLHAGQYRSAGVFGGLEECVRSAALGSVWRDEGLWQA